jgi:hypothetical protein
MGPRRDREYDYLAASYQLAELLEQRAREGATRRALDEIAAEVEEMRQAGLPEAREAARLVDEVRSLLPLAAEAAEAPARFRQRALALHQRLEALGRGLFPA